MVVLLSQASRLVGKLHQGLSQKSSSGFLRIAELCLPCRRVKTSVVGRKKEAIMYFYIESALALLVSLIINICVLSVFAKGFYNREEGDIGLENAGQFLGKTFGPQMKYIWAVGLLAAGKSLRVPAKNIIFFSGGFRRHKLEEKSKGIHPKYLHEELGSTEHVQFCEGILFHSWIAACSAAAAIHLKDCWTINIGIKPWYHVFHFHSAAAFAFILTPKGSGYKKCQARSTLLS